MANPRRRRSQRLQTRFTLFAPHAANRSPTLGPPGEPQHDPRSDDGGLGRSEALTLLCAVAFAFQIQLTNVITRSHSPEAISFVQFGCAVAFSGLTMLAMGVRPADVVGSLGERHVAWTVLYTAVACTVVAMGVLNRYQRDIPATRASVLYMFEPVFAALFALVFTGEAMTPRKLIGGGIILGGNLLCELIGRKAAEKAIQVGESLPKKIAAPAETAAWTLIANLVLNLDETVTRN